MKSIYIKVKVHSYYIGKVFISTMLISIFLRIFVFDVYKVNSESMNPTLMTGDYILVNKLEYGPRLLNVFNYLKKGTVKFHRISGTSSVSANDIVVFESLKNHQSSSSLLIEEEIIVKKCIALPFDSLRYSDSLSPQFIDLKNPSTNIISACQFITIPGNGYSCSLDNDTHYFYKTAYIFENVEDDCDETLFDTPFTYTFTQNYLFVLGDNRSMSYDSRYFGFLPDKMLIGKAELVIFSRDNSKKGINKFRVNRFLRKLH